MAFASALAVLLSLLLLSSLLFFALAVLLSILPLP
jgi:hypothetical protein